VPLHVLPETLRKPGEPFRVAPGVELSGGSPELLLGEELQVVPAGGDERVDEIVPLLGHAFDLVTCLFHLSQQLHGARRGVEAHGVAHPRVFGRVVGEEECHLSLRVWDTSEAGEPGGEAGESDGALGVGPVEGKGRPDRVLFSEALFEGEGDGDDPAVELGDRHLPGGVERRESGGGTQPGLARGGGADPLHDGHPEIFERRDLPLEPALRPVPPLGVGGVRTPARQNGRDEAVYLILEQLQRGNPPVGVSPQRVAIDGQGVGPGLLQRLHERVHERRVASQKVRPVEDHADRRTVRPVQREQVFEGRTLR
jgi:hypothetical protein